MSNKVLNIIFLVLIVIGAVLFIMSMNENVDPIIYGMYAYFGLTVLVAIVSSIMGIMANPKGIKSMLIGLAGMAFVFILAYILADGSDYEMYKDADITAGVSRLSGMLLYAIYILAFGAIGSVIFSWAFKLTR